MTSQARLLSAIDIREEGPGRNAEKGRASAPPFYEPTPLPPLNVLLAKYAGRARRQDGKTQAQIARDAWLGDSYVSRLLSGERFNPSRDALVLLGCWGLGLSVEEMDELLIAAEYKPLVLPASIR